MNRRRNGGVFLLFFSLLLARSLRAADTANSYRLSAFPWYNLTEHFTVFARLGSSFNPEKDNRVSNLISPGGYYTAKSWLQIWGGFNNRYSRNENDSDQFEIRPYVGLKAFVPNDWKLHLYNFTRFEYRAIDDLDTHEWHETQRIRSRFGAEFPLTSKLNAWQPKTFYGLATVEPFFRFDHMEVDPLRVGGGVGYIIDSRFRLEFLYYADFTRPNSASLEYTENIFRLNLKIDLNRKHEPSAPAPAL